jgi:hypothetical protein
MGQWKEVVFHPKKDNYLMITGVMTILLLAVAQFFV